LSVATPAAVDRFDAALAELAGRAIISVGPFIDENARPRRAAWSRSAATSRSRRA
jgi:hypothetical protein